MNLVKTGVFFTKVKTLWLTMNVACEYVCRDGSRGAAHIHTGKKLVTLHA